FDRVAVAFFAVRGKRVAHVKIAIRNAAVAVHFDAIVHTAAARPTVLDQAHGSVGELENADHFVLGDGLIAVNVGAHLAVDGLDCGTPQEPIAERDSMTSHVHPDAAAGAFHIPEPRAVRT